MGSIVPAPEILTDREKSWHLLAVLLSLGRPARPAELASRCALFHATPDLVERLCGIPDSPIFLTDDLFVTASEAGTLAVVRFLMMAVAPCVPQRPLWVMDPRKVWGDLSLTYSRRRKCCEYASVAECMSIGNLSINMSMMASNSEISKESGGMRPIVDHKCVLSSCVSENIDDKKEANEMDVKCNDARAIVVHREFLESVSLPEYHCDTFISETDSKLYKTDKLTDYSGCAVQIYESQKVMRTNGSDSNMKLKSSTAAAAADNEQIASLNETGELASNECHAAKSKIIEDMGEKEKINEQKERYLLNSGAFREDPENSMPPVQVDQIPEVFPSDEPFSFQKQPGVSLDKLKTLDRLSALGMQASFQALGNNKSNASPVQKDKFRKDDKCIPRKKTSKRSTNNNKLLKESNKLVEESKASKAPKSLLDPKPLPNFESFVIENEEGSGGYGTVYRARRKYDEKTFAIKCPHATSYSHHVNNELKMLERFGGRNFVIKYEGSFKSGDSDCLVLEHVEHDRPEVLKRDINIFELQWYGYCMFRALSSLHKQGIVHRDVKPGNFLFSRKLNKGYLIDFNLALDLQQKYCAKSKSKLNSSQNPDHIPLPVTKYASCAPSRKAIYNGYPETINKGTLKGYVKTLESKNVKKRSISHLKTFQESDNTSKFRNQNAELSGITSTKDGTSTRTPSAERTREPVPRHGRKELLSFVQEAMQSPNQKAATAPASHRKRIAAAAPPGNIDKRLILLTPIPLHSGGVSVAGAGMSKARGEGKQKREGPCVGTKGFRAPEVLFRSPHQGCKVDIWSAGVSLLYLILGKTAFFGDPEQNIKEIAKLRGSEDLWEVAKIHSRESSFPMDLLDIRSLQTMELREWCELNTKRLEFLEMIPESLFDLIDRCLVVNPRLRITAEEALMHEFFTPCHESLRKQRLLRRAISSDS
ncbi:hypothetical protein QJS10_CPA10g00996 [Acorus calamus]|uniref:non-specific serine/threonine protein kinase n=1 Tax=Acorus calamus TaxID=4465 RepID=A0AAV9DX73_ACOCL|nr:hypothetical protein QJS10_CPA10g00996 [Acorus calamus]